MKKSKWIISFIVTLLFLMATGCGKKDIDKKEGDMGENLDPNASVDTLITEEAEESQDLIPEIFEEEPEEFLDVEHAKVSVHDPSIIKADGKYYIFGSHMAWAKSNDLMNWDYFKNNINTDYELLMGDIWEEYAKSETNPNLRGNLWAPEVIYNTQMNKYCMYMSVNGDNWNSAIVLLTSDDIEGPYEYIGPVVYSGFSGENNSVDKTDVYKVLGEGADLLRYQSIKNTKLNAIDPNVKYDDEGELWMSFGSWFGGLYLLKLDSQTGLRDYDYTYITEENKSDEYYGYKLAGGWSVSGEGPYINKFGDYYYLFISYGGLAAEGGYQMRVFRSKDIMGPYVDENGVSAVYTQSMNNLNSNIGVRIFGSYKFAGSDFTHVAQGHNSTLLDDDGKMYAVYHTRFARGDKGNPEQHEVYVQQMFLNEDDWLVAAPYEYSGETISENGYLVNQMAGEYEFVIHKPEMYYQIVLKKLIGIAETHNITLNSDGRVSGDFKGSWTYTDGTAYMSIIIDDIEYKGVFLRQANETERKQVMTFTALGDNICVMGSKK